MNPDGLDPALESRAAAAPKSLLQQVASIKFREIRIEPPGAGSPAQLSETPSDSGTDALLDAAGHRNGVAPAKTSVDASRNGSPALEFADRLLTCADCGLEFVLPPASRPSFKRRILRTTRNAASHAAPSAATGRKDRAWKRA